jgi:two-component system LytT family response regulator
MALSGAGYFLEGKTRLRQIPTFLMTKLRLLIVDDEDFARDRLRALLFQESGMEIIGECATGSEAVAAIRNENPDIVFLDVKMPGCDGLQVAAEFPGAQRPVIIFVTAHDHYAVEAFGVDAVDYLLKPFDQARLQLSLRRATAHIRGRREGELEARMGSLLADAQVRNNDRLAFKSGGRVVFLRPDEIVWVEAANNNSILHLADNNELVLYETLSSMEERLGPSGFVRVNRSAMVHFDQVRELQTVTHGDYVVVLQNGLRLPLSRHFRGALEKFAPQQS